MNIIKIKESADNEVIRQSEFLKTKEETLVLINQMLELGNKSGAKWNEKIKIKTTELLNSFRKYFIDNGFEVSERDDKLIAKYKTTSFELSNVNFEGEKIYLQNADDDINVEFWIGLNSSEPDYRVYKDNIAVDRIRSVDYHDENYRTDYIKFVDQFKTIEQLNSIKKKVEININHFNDALTAVDKAELVIHKFGEDKQFRDFDELIKSI